MRFKPGVKVHGVSPEINLAIIVSAAVYQHHGQELVITSVVDGTHSATSLHYAGDAVDLRTRYFDSKETVEQVASDIRERLTDDYDVIVESTHIHIEYQPRK